MACVFAAVFAPVVTAQVAPRISTSRAGDYARLNFSWPNATTMNVAPSGKSVQVTFSNPVGADVGAAAKQLAPYVNGIIRSPDGKTITLNLNQAYRVRHFVSGNTTGLDILTRTPVSESPAVVTPPPPAPSTPAVTPFEAAPTAPKPPILSTKPPTITAPVTQKPKPEIPPTAKAVAAPAPTPAPNKPLEQIKPRDNSVLSTKKPVDPEPKPIPPAPTPEASTAEAPKPLVTPASAPAVKAAPETPAPASEAQTPETEKVAAPEATPEATPEPSSDIPAETTPPAADKPQGALPIGIVPSDEGVTLEFPWNARTALASFARGNDVWLVFDRASTIDMARLSTIVPSSITSVKRFALPGHTILRFTTREPLYPHATAERGTYRWRIQLKKAPPSPLNDTEVYPNQDEAGVSIVFKLFDVANPISFYDPTVSDRWVLAPTYEAGRGVATNHTYPGFTILQTSQGLVIRTDDDALSLTRTRAGLKLARVGGLAVSDKLPFLPGQRSLGQLNALSQNVVLAYDKYFLPDASMAQMRQDIMQRLTHAVDDTARADLLRQLAGMYVAQGYGPEASTILNEIRTLYPEYYAKEKLAILHMAAAFMADRMAEAAYYANDPSIANDKEAQLWRDVVGLFAPIAPPTPVTPKPTEGTESPTPAPESVVVTPVPANFQYLKYQPDYLQYYPPRVRQKLSIIGADRYLQLGNAKSAIKVFDILNEDGILKPIQPYAEYLFGKVAADLDKHEQALKTWQRLIDENSDSYITARARFSTIALKYSQGMIPIEEAIKQLNGVRLAWRGDSLERELLHYLGQLYVDNKQYDEALRTWKELQIAFPSDPEALETSARMATLFEQLYNDGLADEMKPLQSLALFYEFRDLTPVGARGDAMIQKLADRLASVDLLDRAIQLLEHQVKSRTEGLDRARVGARLALLYLIDNKPKRALSALENSNYGSMSEELQILRTQLNAQALAKQKKEAEALAVLRDDTSPRGEQLKLEILWQMQDWPSIINQAEDMLALRKDLTAELTQQEQEMLIQLALAYSFEKDYTQLSYLRDYYMNLIPKDSAYKSTFEYLTNDTTPLDAEDVALLTGQISRTQNFLKNFRDAIASGKLSDATKQ